MSKRLPYYQSEPAEYLAGDIMFCSYGAQGVFTIIRALYWQKDCSLTLDQAKRRITDADSYFDELINEKIIKINGNNINITFLDNQFNDASKKSTTNSSNGKKGAEKRWGKNSENGESIATPLIGYSESIALKEDNIKEEEIKEKEEIKETASPFSFYNSLINAGGNVQLVSDWLKVRKNKKATNTQTAYDSFLKEVVKSKLTINQVLTKCVENSWSGFKSEWQPTISTTKTLNDFHYNANGTMKGVL